MDKHMAIALVFSPDWSPYVAVELYAIFANNPPPVKVYLVSDGEGTLDLDSICKLSGPGYSVEYIDMLPLYQEKITSDINVTSRFTKYVLYRLLFPYIIQEDKLLYIDADAIVNGDITEMYNMDMSDNLLAGVPDCGAGADQYNLKAQIGMAEDELYINAGVALMNLAKMRELKLADIWVNLANTKRFHCQDQDIWNLTCRGRIKELDLAYNVSVSTGMDIEAENIKICHYAGWAHDKPWCNPNVPFYEIWKRWAKQYGTANT